MKLEYIILFIFGITCCVFSIKRFLEHKNYSQYKCVVQEKAPFLNNYYSQDGEDVLLFSLYEEKPEYKGFYVDIGAHHPFRVSNTQLFYEKGWRGINIDATPGSMIEFERQRPEDINIEIGIADKKGTMCYYIFEEPGYNSFDEKLSLERLDLGHKTGNPGLRLKNKTRVRTDTLNNILSKNLPSGQKIDFISIDIEGFEENVLRNFDFGTYAPSYFVVEELDCVGKDFRNLNTSVSKILTKEGYVPLLKANRSVIYGKK